eukprot:8266438-Alexandrium_andersonii.AAC.1
MCIRDRPSASPRRGLPGGAAMPTPPPGPATGCATRGASLGAGASGPPGDGAGVPHPPRA